jgi:murein DD-endopeptidase MepM/ murein hydrolase activator NlpD
MQHNNDSSKSGRFRKFFQEKGYYIVLFLCIAAVGISGYLFLSSAVAEKNSLNDQTLSVATSAAVPSGRGKTQKTGAKADDGSAEPDSARESAETAAILEGDDAARANAASLRVWPVSGQALAGYSMDALRYNATMKDWRTHEGVDLAAKDGESVKAACAGTVTAVYDDEFLGTTVVLTHADGYSTQYSNLAAVPAVKVGDSVEAGAVIGSVGGTAILEAGEEPHLHFAAFCNGTPMDPADYID